MKFLLINRFVPPDVSPTACLLRDLGRELERRGHEVAFLGDSADYRGLQARKGSRLVGEVRSLATILWQGLWRRKVDGVVCLSTPTCLAVVGAILARRHRARLVHWVMDVYPEIALALDEVRSAAGCRLIQGVMRLAYHECDQVIALDEDMAERLSWYGLKSIPIVPPWPLQENASLAELQYPRPPSVGGRWRWLYSGNLGRAHEWEVLIRVQEYLERENFPVELYVRGSGAGYLKARELASSLGLEHVYFHDYVDEQEFFRELSRVHLIVATQRPETRGYIWPSKLALFLWCLPWPLLWIGPRDGALTRYLREREATGVFSADEIEAIASWMVQLFQRRAYEVRGGVTMPSEVRQIMVERMTQLVEPSL